MAPTGERQGVPAASGRTDGLRRPAQWATGCGTDAAPYFRVFNPVAQGLKFAPRGDYVRRYLPELAQLPGPLAHEPWADPQGYTHGYPRRIVDHAAERTEALRRLSMIKAEGGMIAWVS